MAELSAHAHPRRGRQSAGDFVVKTRVDRNRESDLGYSHKDFLSAFMSVQTSFFKTGLRKRAAGWYVGRS